jgi:hypothetical protein
MGVAARQTVDQGHAVVLDEATGKPKYVPVVDFANHGIRRR